LRGFTGTFQLPPGMKPRLLLPFLFLCTLLHAADWPKWRGPEANGTTPEKISPETWDSEGPRRLWKTKVPRTACCSACGQRRKNSGMAVLLHHLAVDGERLVQVSDLVAWNATPRA
jgi:hypothetical protein